MFAGDVSAMTPGGIRVGTPALTSRYAIVLLFIIIHCFSEVAICDCSGFTEEDFDQVAEYYDRAVTIAENVKQRTGSKLKDFKALLADGGIAKRNVSISDLILLMSCIDNRFRGA